MDGLGLGPHGPPIPPPATFAVVPYPVRRRPPLGVDPPSHYVFVASSPDDPNAPQDDKSKEAEPEVEKTPEKPPVSLSLHLFILETCSISKEKGQHMKVPFSGFHRNDWEPAEVSRFYFNGVALEFYLRTENMKPPHTA